MFTPQELLGKATTHVVPFNLEREALLHPQAAKALPELIAAARLEGIRIEIVSAFRSFERQLSIWNRKFSGELPLLDRESNPLEAACLGEEERIFAILNWSALPGASRHHWGTEVDLIDAGALGSQGRYPLVSAQFALGGPFSRLTDWLVQNAQRWDFFHPYDVDRGGVAPEPWHLSYFPVAQRALSALNIELLRDAIQREAILGRPSILGYLERIFDQYVIRINPKIHEAH